jgi:hypothetical protein
VQDFKKWLENWLRRTRHTKVFLGWFRFLSLNWLNIFNVKQIPEVW